MRLEGKLPNKSNSMKSRYKNIKQMCYNDSTKED